MTHDASRVTVEVAAGLIMSRGQYLIARRKPKTHLGGLWEFPGGKRRESESLEECLHRELREELGIDIAPPVLLTTIKHEYPDRSVELHFFRCTLQSGQPQALGCEEFRWVTREELPRFDFPPADRSLLEALQNEVSD